MSPAMDPPYDGSDEPEAEIERRLEEWLASVLLPDQVEEVLALSRRWRQALREVPGGHLCFDSLEREIHLSEREKLDLLIHACVNFLDQERQREIGYPVPRPLEAL